MDFCDPDQIKVKQVLEEFEVLLPKASDSESDMESEPDSGENISENEGQGGAANEQRSKKKIAKGKKGAQRANWCQLGRYCAKFNSRKQQKNNLNFIKLQFQF